MIQAGVVARLAVRELWISFRLLLVLVAFAFAGALVALLPAPLGVTMQRLALGLGIATVLTAAAAAWSLAEERQQGRAGWLVSRALSRGSLLAGWFIAFAAIGLAGLIGAGLLGWLAASSVSLRLEAPGYVALFGGVAASAGAAIALGLLAGTLVPPRLAAVLATVGCLLAVTPAWLGPADATLVPGGALVALAALIEPGSSVAPGVRATGSGLAAAAVLLAAARIAFDRVEL